MNPEERLAVLERFWTAYSRNQSGRWRMPDHENHPHPEWPTQDEARQDLREAEDEARRVLGDGAPDTHTQALLDLLETIGTGTSDPLPAGPLGRCMARGWVIMSLGRWELTTIGSAAIEQLRRRAAG